jgi:rhodanese-related sulfurtransferase
MKNKKNTTKQISRKASQKRKQHNPRLWLLLLLILPIALAFFLINYYRNKNVPNVQNEIPTEQETDALPAEISVSEAYDLYTNGAYMLDVRELDEWRDGHIPGATLIPLEELVTAYQTLPISEPIVIVCRSGNRSAQARYFLKSIGFTQVTSMAGGMNEWKAAGYDWVMGD